MADPTAEFSLPESWTRIMGLRLPWFLQVSSRIGGALVLLVVSLLIPFLG